VADRMPAGCGGGGVRGVLPCVSCV
jgi:hypothetical protein